MFRYKYHIINALAAITLTGLATACAQEDLEAPVPSTPVGADTQLVVNLAVPYGNASESDEASSRAGEMTPTDNEGRINTLRLIAFGYSGGTSVVERQLLIPSKMPVNPDATAQYQISGVNAGEYAVYIIANVGNELDGVTSETELKARLMDFTSKMPEAGNLPMVYEPSARIKIDDAGQTPANLTASMKIAAVKVKYNIVFDKSLNEGVFGTSGLKISDVSIANVPTKAYVVTNTTPAGFTTRSIAASGAYFNDFSENPANASATDKDVITVAGNGAAAPASYTGKWVWQGTAYLPESYVAQGGSPVTMNINAVVTDASGNEGNIRCKYSINLAAYDENKSELSMPRGSYYEMIAKVKTLGEAELDAAITVKDWTETLLATDFTHTYLTLDRTEASITSLEDDVIGYQTDGRGSIGFTCELPILSGKPAVIATINTQTKKITFSVNPEVDITKIENNRASGTADCYITAGNIRKKVSVKYDITPFFTVTPVAVKIQWSSTAALNTKVFEYETNLGGIRLTKAGSAATILGGSTTSYTDNVGSSQIRVSCTNPGLATGQITVTALKDPGTTTMHYFDAYPAATSVSGFKEALEVTVMPPLGDYRIYFRAINDWHAYDGGSTTQEFLSGQYSDTGSYYPVEDYGSYSSSSASKSSRNWEDWWSNQSYEIDRRIYIYTQIGETVGTTPPPAWIFTRSTNPDGNVFHGESMKHDDSNPGWDYYDLATTRSATTNNQTKYPEPGKTLVIFHNDQYVDQGYNLHRAAHHLDPGIPLFDFEDREGYVLYDPTTEPYYKIYDEKPYIEDVVYTVYSESKVTGWWKQYGVAANEVGFNNPPQFTIWSNHVTTTTEVINGKTWQKATIRLKAPRGDYEKAIRLNGLASGTSTSSMPHRIYLGVYGSDWGMPPRIYIYKSDGSVYKDWNSTDAMTLLEGSTYYYNIPAGYDNGLVIFQSNDRSKQYPASGGIQLNPNKNEIRYTDNWGYSAEYGEQPGTTSSTDPGVMLFGGRSFAQHNHVGTYQNGQWKGGKP